jgi:hypothetical protein
MYKNNAMTRVGIAAMIGGFGLAIFGVVFMLWIYPKFEVVPDDLERIVELEGEYTLVDQTFLDGLLANATLGQMIASGAAGGLLGDPSVLEALNNPALAAVTSDPSLVALLQNPEALQLLGGPTVAALLGNATLLGALADPEVIAALADPAALPALLAHPVLGPMLADPTIAALLTNPLVLGLIQTGVITKLAANPEILALLGDPTMGALLANPAVQALLADPAALGLVLDPRTQQVLANPANLPIVTLPVLVHRERRGVSKDGDTLTMSEQVTTTNTATGGGVPGFEPTDVTLIVDARSKKYLDGTDEGRTGQWGLPFHPSKNLTYPSYLSVARQPLPLVFDGEEEILGLQTYRYVIKTTNSPMGVLDPAGTGLPLVVDTNVVVWVEVETGAGVKATDFETISALDPAGNKYTRFTADIVYSDDTVARLVADVGPRSDDIKFYGTTLPWIVIAVGFIILFLGLFLLLRDHNRQGKLAEEA